MYYCAQIFIFCIYINYLIKSSNIFNYLVYADDTTLYFNLEDIDSVNLNENITYT